MCVPSMIMDHYRDKLYPHTQPGGTTPNTTPQVDWTQLLQQRPQISQAEIDEFRTLLERAREYDKRNNEPSCEMAEKRDAILAIAKQLGVEISFL